MRGLLFRKHQRGGAAVEFALILPIFVMLLSAILDYGMYFYVASSATQSVRNGVRMAVTKRNKADMENLGANLARDTLANNFNIPCVFADGCKFSHNHRTLTYGGDNFLTYELTMDRPFIAPMGIVPVPKSHRISYTMRYEF